ncbi:hypothetical protein INR49_030586 [Caranx melampygus]|nr:hypothetical protein INR49_030586 [Caranx melampygus]
MEIEGILSSHPPKIYLHLFFISYLQPHSLIICVPACRVIISVFLRSTVTSDGVDGYCNKEKAEISEENQQIRKKSLFAVDWRMQEASTVSQINPVTASGPENKASCWMPTDPNYVMQQNSTVVELR